MIYARWPWDRIVSASDDATARVWDAETGREVATLVGHEGPVSALAYHPTEAMVATGGADGSIRLWDSEAGRGLHHLKAHTGLVAGVTFTPDGRRLVSVGRDGNLILWDVETGHEVLTLRGAMNLAAQAAPVAFTRDGREIIVSGISRFGGGGAFVWEGADPADVDSARDARLAVLAFASACDRADWSRAAAFHERLFALRYEDHNLRLECGGRYAEAGRWAEAKADYEAVFTSNPPADPRHWYEYAVLLIALGDREGHRRHCKAMARRFETPNGLSLTYSIHTCLLAKDAGGQPDHVLRLGAIKFAAPAQNPDDASWSRFLLTLARYRAGQLDDITLLTEADAAALTDFVMIYHSLVQAMTLHRRGELGAARQWYTRAAARLTRYSGDIPTAGPYRAHPPQWQWRDWLAVELLRSEAAELLGVVAPLPRLKQSNQ